MFNLLSKGSQGLKTGKTTESLQIERPWWGRETIKLPEHGKKVQPRWLPCLFLKKYLVGGEK